ncbi:hypothetical protein P20495_0224 [Pseudoalteromonas sp. BSi20495]|nr:hypothetical protein P20495_0224 [Pseudoalteromonas sp. BSi20495]
MNKFNPQKSASAASAIKLVSLIIKLTSFINKFIFMEIIVDADFYF